LDGAVSVTSWVADRVPTEVVHLDVAGAGRISRTALAAEHAHLEREALVGPYVAEASVDLLPGREALGAMAGLTGADVFFSEGASPAFALLLQAWPLARDARIGTLPSEYGGNARVLADTARHRGWHLVELPVDAIGRLQDVPTGLDLVTFPQVASQRGVLQPVADVLATGTPLLLDVAQSLGQVAVPPGAAAYVGTSRKWLCGPRGVGFGLVDPAWHEQLGEALTNRHFEVEGTARFDSVEAHVAGRVGLSQAARSWSPALIPVIAAATAAARVLLDGAGGWRVVEPFDEPTGITTLTHDTADPFATRLSLLEEGLLTNAIPTHRAADLTGPVLRVSTAGWVTPADLERLSDALERRT
jgi:pyridoxal 5-phosphate dependent beta-lyase